MSGYGIRHGGRHGGRHGSWHKSWYERELRWPTAGGGPSGPFSPVSLVTGVRFDVLDVPAEAGLEVLARFTRTGPVALDERRARVRLLVAAGSAEELPGLLDWLEWGGIPLDLTALGAGGRMAAPAVPWGVRREVRRETADDRCLPVWLRPPEPGGEVERSLPAMDVAGGTGRSGPCWTDGEREGPVGLVTLVAALATACHRMRLRSAKPLSGRPGRRDLPGRPAMSAVPTVAVDVGACMRAGAGSGVAVAVAVTGADVGTDLGTDVGVTV